MRTYLQSLGYTILRWAEWCEDHMEYEVLSPTGERLVAEAERLLIPVKLRGESQRGGWHVTWCAQDIHLVAA